MMRYSIGYVPVRCTDGKCGNVPWLDSYAAAVLLGWRYTVQDGIPRRIVPVTLAIDESLLQSSTDATLELEIDYVDESKPAC